MCPVFEGIGSGLLQLSAKTQAEQIAWCPFFNDQVELANRALPVIGRRQNVT